ncbi:NAD(P)-bd-dom domain-containing protein [Mycena kentingensis (nom. inval.)]|nr:NAD(P)-bd-dom domain-containing protein [Mycena kentingensis (nom. inval.)]
MAATNMNILAIGASRNIGYQSAVRLLEKGARITFLLRNPSSFANDQTIQAAVQSGRAKLVKGDAMNEADCRLAWETAGLVDALVFSVGGIPKTTLKGFVLETPDLVTKCLLNTLCTMPTYPSHPQPKIVCVSSIGLTPTAHKALPTLMKPLYAMLDNPHADKLAMERVLFHCAGWPWDAASGVPDPAILGVNWQARDGLPAPGTLKRVLIVRPAWLTDGKSQADEIEAGRRKKHEKKAKLGYRYGEEELGAYVISRADMAHFIANCFDKWNELENKRINVGY